MIISEMTQGAMLPEVLSKYVHVIQSLRRHSSNKIVLIVGDPVDTSKYHVSLITTSKVDELHEEFVETYPEKVYLSYRNVILNAKYPTSQGNGAMKVLLVTYASGDVWVESGTFHIRESSSAPLWN